MKSSKISFFIAIVLLLSGCSIYHKQHASGKESSAVLINNKEFKTTPSKYSKEIVKDARKGIIPKSIEIPAIGVSASVEKVGLLDDGEMAVPESSKTTGWYEQGFKPGEPGNAVIAGHVDSKKGPAVFFHLKKLKQGDDILVVGHNGEKLEFEVVDVKKYPRQEAPLRDIFGFTYRSSLNLITCTGVYDPKSTQHSERLVVYTQLKNRPQSL